MPPSRGGNPTQGHVDVRGNQLRRHAPAEHAANSTDMRIHGCSDAAPLNQGITDHHQFLGTEVNDGGFPEQPDQRSQGQPDVIDFAGLLSVLT